MTCLSRPPPAQVSRRQDSSPIAMAAALEHAPSLTQAFACSGRCPKCTAARIDTSHGSAALEALKHSPCNQSCARCVGLLACGAHCGPVQRSPTGIARNRCGSRDVCGATAPAQVLRRLDSSLCHNSKGSHGRWLCLGARRHYPKLALATVGAPCL